MKLRTIALCGMLAASFAAAQETKLGADFRREGTKLREECTSVKTLFGCASTLVTDHPLHLAAGSLAPQNGVGFGGAFVAAKNTTNFRNTWNADGVASMNGSWRAGAYMNTTWVRRRQIVARPGGSGPSNLAVSEYPVFQLYGEHTSLKNVTTYGSGPNSRREDRRLFEFAETIAGARTVFPIFSRINLAFEGEANGRVVNVNPHFGGTAPALLVRANDAYMQFGEGLRIRPTLFDGHIRFNYSARAQHFIGIGNAPTFQRVNFDFQHEIPLYGTSTATANSGQGPDDCSIAAPDRPCPPLPKSRNRNGSISARVMMTESYLSGFNFVPFYFQPTLGGSDINGTPTLAGFQDYRFRAPNTFLVRAAFEHSIWGPLGFAAIGDWGKASFNRFDASNLRHSFSTGFTLRAGSVPLVYLLFSFGSGEGNHTNARIDSSLLGSGGRPSLY